VILADPEQFLRRAYDYVIIGKPRTTRFQMRARPAMMNARWGHRRAGCCSSVRLLYSLLSKRFEHRRLSEDPRLKIGVIEAGNAKFNDSLVDTPSMSSSAIVLHTRRSSGFVGRAIGNPIYDWNFVSVPQINAANQITGQARWRFLSSDRIRTEA
jgi:hypothetical protein